MCPLFNRIFKARRALCHPSLDYWPSNCCVPFQFSKSPKLRSLGFVSTSLAEKHATNASISSRFCHLVLNQRISMLEEWPNNHFIQIFTLRFQTFPPFSNKDRGSLVSDCVPVIKLLLPGPRQSQVWKVSPQDNSPLRGEVNIVSAMVTSLPHDFRHVVREAAPPTEWYSTAYSHLNLRISWNWNERLIWMFKLQKKNKYLLWNMTASYCFFSPSSFLVLRWYL